MSRLPHFLDNWLIHSGKVVSPRCWLPFTPGRFLGTHFRYRLSRPHDNSAAGMIRSIEKPNDLIRIWTHNLPACSIVHQPCYCVPPSHHERTKILTFHGHGNMKCNLKRSPASICDVDFICNQTQYSNHSRLYNTQFHRTKLIYY
jgi:hypothetical protein